jgi:type I restriction enzyme M protein
MRQITLFLFDNQSINDSQIAKQEVKPVKEKKAVKQKSMEETLWESANKLRGTVESSEYKHVVLSLIFLKFASDKFVERRQELIAEHKERFMEMKEFYNQKNVFYLPEESRWSYIIQHAKQDDITLVCIVGKL